MLPEKGIVWNLYVNEVLQLSGKAFCQQHGKPVPDLEVKISKKGSAPRSGETASAEA